MAGIGVQLPLACTRGSDGDGPMGCGLRKTPGWAVDDKTKAREILRGLFSIGLRLVFGLRLVCRAATRKLFRRRLFREIDADRVRTNPTKIAICGDEQARTIFTETAVARAVSGIDSPKQDTLAVENVNSTRTAGPYVSIGIH